MDDAVYAQPSYVIVLLISTTVSIISQTSSNFMTLEFLMSCICFQHLTRETRSYPILIYLESFVGNSVGIFIVLTERAIELTHPIYCTGRYIFIKDYSIQLPLQAMKNEELKKFVEVESGPISNQYKLYLLAIIRSRIILQISSKLRHSCQSLLKLNHLALFQLRTHTHTLCSDSFHLICKITIELDLFNHLLLLTHSHSWNRRSSAHFLHDNLIFNNRFIQLSKNSQSLFLCILILHPIYHIFLISTKGSIKNLRSVIQNTLFYPQILLVSIIKILRCIVQQKLKLPQLKINQIFYLFQSIHKIIQFFHSPLQFENILVLSIERMIFFPRSLFLQSSALLNPTAFLRVVNFCQYLSHRRRGR